MSFFSVFQKNLKIFLDLKFAIFLLLLIALFSSLGSIIEQNQTITFYQTQYSFPLYGFFDWKFILFFSLDKIYDTWFFWLLLLLLGISLITCTIFRQFPLFQNSRFPFFKKQKESFFSLFFFKAVVAKFYSLERLLGKFQQLDYSIYQKRNLFYAYKGLVGRISPILVHFSLIGILLSSFYGATTTFKAQEIVPKGGDFHVQNMIQTGYFTKYPEFSLRLNDFWIEYKEKSISQFYSNFSILENLGKEKKNQTISVNNPIRYNSLDIYQSDWNLLAVRIQNNKNLKEYPLFSIPEQKNMKKIWITWLPQNYSIVFSDFSQNFLLYDNNSKFLKEISSNEYFLENLRLLEILPTSGILLKYDPSIPFLYFSFFALMLTSLVSYLPFSQFWFVKGDKIDYLGATTNRGKIQLEIQFKNFLLFLEKSFQKPSFFTN